MIDGADGSPDRAKKKKSKPTVSDTSSYSNQSGNESSGESDDMDVDFMPLLPGGKFKDTAEECGLCGLVHGAQSGECFMTDKSEYLAEYREMLIKYANEEPWEERVK